MTLTLRLDKNEDELINKLKEIYNASTASYAILKAVNYVAKEYQADQKLITALEEEIESLKEKDHRIKSMIKQIKQVGSRLSDYCEI